MSCIKVDSFLKKTGAFIDGITPESNANQVFSTDAYSIEVLYKSWSLQTSLSGTDNSAIINVEVSNDGNNWDTIPNGENIIVASNDSQTVFDSFFPFKFLRVSYDGSTITTGKVKISIILK